MQTQFQIITTQEGSGPVCPAGSFITAHYHGTLEDGSVFDSSVKKGRPFKCQIGVGEVIRGWDEAFTQMKKGQKAKLICPYDYAYGEHGHPPVIPPKATLTFEVELLDFIPSVRASHILLKHTGSRNPIVRATGKPVTRTEQEAINGINQIIAAI